MKSCLCFLIVMTTTITLCDISIGQELYLIAGQSNAVGQGDSTKSILPKAENCFEFDASNNVFIPLKDPVGKPWKLFQKAGTGSISPSFANRMHELTGKDIYIVTAARGGASCSRKAEMSNYDTWDTTGNLFVQAVEKTRLAEAKSGKKLSGIIWMQGERDANAILSGNMTEQDYQSALIGLIARFRKEFGKTIPVYIVQTAFQQDKAPDGCLAVRDVQLNISRNIKHVFLCYNETGDFQNRKWFKDFVHYNQEALNDIGKKSAEFIFGLSKKNKILK